MKRVANQTLLTPADLSRRWKKFNYVVKPSTLANWRWKGIGPKFIKPSKEVFYPLAQVVAWEVAKGIRKVRRA